MLKLTAPSVLSTPINGRWPMLHLVGQNFWQERRKCRTPCGTFFRNKACVQRLLPPLRKKREKGLFRIAWAAPAWGGVAVHIYLSPMTDHNKTGAQSTAENSRRIFTIWYYFSRLPKNRTFQGNRKKFRVIGGSKQISGNKEMEWGRNIWQKIKTRNWNNFNVSDCSVLFFDLSGHLKHGSSYRGWIYIEITWREKNYFELARGSSYRGKNYSKCMNEIDFDFS